MAALTSKKTISILILIIILAGGTFTLVKKSGDSNNNDATNNTGNNSSASSDKVYDPAELFSDSYVGQEVSVKGTLIKIDDGTYILAGTSNKKPNSIKVDFSKSNLDVSKYYTAGSNSKKPPQYKTIQTSPNEIPDPKTGQSIAKQPVTIRGKVLKDPDSTGSDTIVYIQAISISQ